MSARVMRIWMLEDSAERWVKLQSLLDRQISRSPNVDFISDEHTKAEVWFLDHDLCKAPPGQPCPEIKHGCLCDTGTTFLKKHGKAGSPKLVFVHSANPQGNERMTLLAKDMYPEARVYSVPVSTWTKVGFQIRAIINKEFPNG